MTQRSNRAIRILVVTNTLVLVAGAMLAPIYAIFIQDIGGDLLDASITMGIFSVVAGITTWAAGRYADTIRESERIIVVGYCLMAFGFFLYLYATSVYWLFAIQALIGFAEALYSPAFNALYSRHLTRGRAATEWGMWEAANYFSATAGAMTGGLIANQFGFPVLFLCMMGLCVTSAVYLFFSRGTL